MYTKKWCAVVFLLGMVSSRLQGGYCDDIKMGLWWLVNPFEVIGHGNKERLKEKYGSKCQVGRCVIKALHWKPYTYVIHGLWYCALITGAIQGSRKVVRFVRKTVSKRAKATLSISSSSKGGETAIG